MTAIDDLVERAIELARTDDVHAAVAALADALAVRGRPSPSAVMRR